MLVDGELAKRERASANHAACTTHKHVIRGTSDTSRISVCGIRGRIHLLSVYPLHQRVTPGIICDLHLLLPVASANATAATELKYLDSALVANIHRNIIRLRSVLNHRDKSKSHARQELSCVLSSYNIELSAFLRATFCIARHVASCHVFYNSSFETDLSKIYFSKNPTTIFQNLNILIHTFKFVFK